MGGIKVLKDKIDDLDGVAGIKAVLSIKSFVKQISELRTDILTIGDFPVGKPEVVGKTGLQSDHHAPAIPCGLAYQPPTPPHQPSQKDPKTLLRYLKSPEIKLLDPGKNPEPRQSVVRQHHHQRGSLTSNFSIKNKFCLTTTSRRKQEVTPEFTGGRALNLTHQFSKPVETPSWMLKTVLTTSGEFAEVSRLKVFISAIRSHHHHI
ncbi:hypothetical protein KQX54_005466 [Cotesia glomerata]|uniref:Uncharacterized protein n=1 Tax=Cotesia glomerata TaxID=32391 RepID=A0AAV7HBQ9_COTGL|nr:hypothetical protein KQX54_005466 [Cotesia glomerata]